MAPSEPGPVVGIDLGTTNSLIAIADGSGPRILARQGTDDLVPSVVRYAGERVEAVGAAAADGLREHPERTVYSFKRYMGRALSDREMEADTASYRVVEGDRGLAVVEVDGRKRTPQEISGDLLRHLRREASEILGSEVRRAVITVPAYFDDAQRQATRDAGRLAGLEVLRILNEPTAAALAYGIGEGQSAETIVVYDLGGGTFDVTVLEVMPPEAEDEESIFRVLSTAGDSRLGGDDFDRVLVRPLDEELRGSDLSGHDLAHRRALLRVVGERAKIALGESEATRLLVDGAGLLPDVDQVLTRDAFESEARPLVDRTIALCAAAVRDAGIETADIDRVVMVGGSTRMPMVRTAVEKWFERPVYTALDPDRVVALGAAVQGAILSGARRDALLLDVVPLGLGLETAGGAVAKLVMKNTTVPVRATEMFSTSVDGQKNVALHVLQGEREMAEDCRSLARFELRGLPPMPAGIPQIEVEFQVDANGVLGVEAVERRSGRRARVQVVPSHGLTREEVDRIEAESFDHAREDMLVHRVVDLAVNASLDVKWIGEALARVREELDPRIIGRVETCIAKVEAYIEASRSDPRSIDADDFHAAKERLDRESVPVHEASIARSLRNSPPEDSGRGSRAES